MRILIAMPSDQTLTRREALKIAALGAPAIPFLGGNSGCVRGQLAALAA